MMLPQSSGVADIVYAMIFLAIVLSVTLGVIFS